MKIEARGVKRTPKYCDVCQENFGSGFSFCPVCGEPLIAVEAKSNPPFGAPLQSEDNQSQPEESVTALSDVPMVENTAQFVNHSLLKSDNESSVFQENQNDFDEDSSVIMKFAIPIERSANKTVEQQKPVSKKPLKPSLVVAITISMALVFGITLDSLMNQASFSKAVSSKSFPSAPLPQTEIAAKEDDSSQNVEENNSPQSVANKQFEQQKAPQTVFIGKSKKSDKNRESNTAVPLKVAVENGKMLRQEENLSMQPKRVFIPNPSANPAIKENLLERSSQPPLKEKAVKYENPKRTGDKSFFNKIGSGLLYLPKMIFKKKRR